MTNNLFALVSSAYDAWTEMEQPASYVTQGRIARGRVWLQMHPADTPGYEDAVKLLARLREQIKLERWEEGIEGSAAWNVLADWHVARIKYEEAEAKYLAALGAARRKGAAV